MSTGLTTARIDSAVDFILNNENCAKLTAINNDITICINETHTGSAMQSAHVKPTIETLHAHVGRQFHPPTHALVKNIKFMSLIRHAHLLSKIPSTSQN